MLKVGKPKRKGAWLLCKHAVEPRRASAEPAPATWVPSERDRLRRAAGEAALWQPVAAKRVDLSSCRCSEERCGAPAVLTSCMLESPRADVLSYIGICIIHQTTSICTNQCLRSPSAA